MCYLSLYQLHVHSFILFQPFLFLFFFSLFLIHSILHFLHFPSFSLHFDYLFFLKTLHYTIHSLVFFFFSISFVKSQFLFYSLFPSYLPLLRNSFHLKFCFIVSRYIFHFCSPQIFFFQKSVHIFNK